MAEWNDELKAKVIKMYQDAEPTPENSVETVASIAEELGEDYTTNGVRIILSRAEVYIKKADAKKSTTTKDGASKRINKADAVTSLNEAIEAQGLEPDSDIISKLTGKAAAYFSEIITKSNEEG